MKNNMEEKKYITKITDDFIGKKVRCTILRDILFTKCTIEGSVWKEGDDYYLLHNYQEIEFEHHIIQEMKGYLFANLIFDSIHNYNLFDELELIEEKKENCEIVKNGDIEEFIKKGFKETEGKLPVFTVLCVQFPKAVKEIAQYDQGYGVPIYTYYREALYLCEQFPKAINEIVKCSVIGHDKYKDIDKDWLNFSRVEDHEFKYSNAWMRHKIEGNTINEKDSTDKIKVYHSAQAIWNKLALIETGLRDPTIYRHVWHELQLLEIFLENEKDKI